MITYTSGEDAVKIIQSGNRVFLHGGAATPHCLIQHLVNRFSELRGVELVSISLQGDAIFTHPRYKNSFYTNSLFVSSNIREAVNNGQGDYVPIFLSEIPLLFRRNILPLDVALVQVSPPDKHGYCSLGPSVDIANTAIKCAKYVIAQVNPRMPRTQGDGIIHVTEFNAMVYQEQELPEIGGDKLPGAVAARIGEYCATLVEDGATIQTGIGQIPDATLASLTNHKELGVHTEMFSDGIINLVEKGIITNQHKKRNRGKIVTAFILGTRRLYDFVDDNPMVEFRDIDYVNDTAVIRMNPKVTAINSAVEVDLTGQVCSDSIGTYQFSGVGGQMDFIRGAALSEGGKPIIALPSVTSNGISRITPFLKQGAGVVTTRAHVHYVVTEYGIANLFGKNLRQRAEALIKIAHPDHRDALELAVFNRFNKQ
ncbi:acetyl-CoA hydrolase/transferase family protein [Adhaeribacter aquaticus]|uniref:acetyl-CoA hydrolase/transferase family protein n=1 Tax=Adhaeribacter aquaticus TaxID=299567 RepID=UPI000419BD85|nr:acetyl-CoA hydrolase/transferase C-terminal domain-containing protein [Adhaeribacter aquaticus]